MLLLNTVATEEKTRVGCLHCGRTQCLAPLRTDLHSSCRSSIYEPSRVFRIVYGNLRSGNYARVVDGFNLKTVV
jgi:hypothetical protein